MGFDGPVCLTNSAPLEAYSGKLILYDVIDSSAVARSAVLSCIVEAGGEAVLPDSLILSEFKMWLKHGNVKKSAAKKWAFTLLCTVMKASDVLNDGRVGEWVQLAVSKLPTSRYVSGHCSPQEASDGLAKLSHPLRRRVLAAAAVDSDCLHRLLGFLPFHDHAAVLEATITDTKTLEAPLSVSLKIAKALPSIPASPPSFLSLNVHSHDHHIMHPSSSSQTAATCLAQAIQHHSGLTSLQIKLPCMTSVPLELLAPAIASLTSLQSLLLHSSTPLAPLHSSFGPESLPTLQQIVHALPHLQHLSISLSSGGTRKRTRDDESGPFRSHCLVPMLSAASGLTSLELFSVRETSRPLLIQLALCGPACKFQATSILHMPQLRQLKIQLDSTHTLACASILGALRAPLTSLDIFHDEGILLPPPFVNYVRKLFSSLAMFTALQTLTLATPVHDSSAEDMQRCAMALQASRERRAPNVRPPSTHQGPVPDPLETPRPHKPETRIILDAASSGVPTALAALPRLTSLNLSADVSVMLLAAPVMATVLTQLTALTLTLYSWTPSWGAWPALPQLLAQLRPQRLQVLLKLTHMDSPRHAALPLMPHPTALSLTDWACLASLDDCEALARMTQLRKLHLAGVRLPTDLRGDCARCLGALPALTSLVFQSATAEGCVSGVLEENVPAGALKALQKLGLDIWGRFKWFNPADDEDESEEMEYDTTPAVETTVCVGRFAKRLPALVRLDLLLEHIEDSYGPEDDLSELLLDIKRGSESGREVEVSHDRQLPF